MRVVKTRSKAPLNGTIPVRLRMPLDLSPARLLLCATLTVGCQRSDAPPVSAPAVNVAEVRAKADQGDPKAELALADLYVVGASEQGLTQDFKEALRWYQKSADQGNAPAANKLGELREAGQGAPPSFTEAEKWYRKAAEAGEASAQYNLAVLYAFGRGVRLNEGEAVRWYRAAAQRGHALAQFNLGQRCVLGKGVSADPVEGFKWLSLAADTIPDSAKLRDEVKGRMSRDQLAQARQQIAAFKPVKSE